MAESKERTEEERVFQERIRAHPRAGEAARRSLRTAEYLRNGSEKNVHRRAGEVKERVRGREAPQEEDGDRRLARSRGGTEQREGIRREDGKEGTEEAEFSDRAS